MAAARGINSDSHLHIGIVFTFN